jgi:hypothetical protein
MSHLLVIAKPSSNESRSTNCNWSKIERILLLCSLQLQNLKLFCIFLILRSKHHVSKRFTVFYLLCTYLQNKTKQKKIRLKTPALLLNSELHNICLQKLHNHIPINTNTRTQWSPGIYKNLGCPKSSASITLHTHVTRQRHPFYSPTGTVVSSKVIPTTRHPKPSGHEFDTQNLMGM